MIKRIFGILSLVMVGMLLFSTVALADTFSNYMVISVLNNGTNVYPPISILASINNAQLDLQGYITPAGLDTNMQEGAVNTPYMVDTVNTGIGTDGFAGGQKRSYFYRMGNVPPQTSFPVVVGYGGNVTVTDFVPDLGNNFTWSTTGYVETSAGKAKILGEKLDGAFCLRDSSITDGTIHAEISSYYLDWISANQDYLLIPDSGNFSFTDGAGNDYPFTIIAWARFDNVADRTLVNKYIGAGDLREWRFFTDTTGNLTVECYKFDDAAAKIGKRTTSINAGQWTQYAVTYNGSETGTGINIYVNGIDSDVTDVSLGAYAGMTDRAVDVEIGSNGGGAALFFDGGMAEIKVYKNRELTPAEILADYQGTYTSTNQVCWLKVNEGIGLPQDYSGSGSDASAPPAGHEPDWILGFPWTEQHALATVSATGVIAGNQTVTVTANVTYLSIAINGTQKDAVALGGAFVPDNNNDYKFMEGNSMPYASSTTISINGTQQLWFEPSQMPTGTALPDRSGNGHNGLIAWGANPPDIEITIGALTSSSSSTYLSGNGTEILPQVVVIPDIELYENTTATGSNLPQYELMKAAADSLEWTAPTLYGFFMIGTAGVMFIAGLVTTSVPIIAAAIGLSLLGMAGSTGIIAPIIVAAVAIMVIALIVIIKKG